MDASRAFEVAFHHYRKGNDLLAPMGVPIEEQALRLARAAAHFGAGNLALALARAQLEGYGEQPQGQAAVADEEHGHPQERQ
jgi:hypothetical protein